MVKTIIMNEIPSSKLKCLESQPNNFSEADICVVITCYNESLIEVIYCINAILENNIPEAAILFINDNPQRVIRSNRIKLFFPNIHLVENANNSGVSFCRNFGIDYATKINKKFIAFCDADDTWVKTKIREQLAYINKGYYVVTTGMCEKNNFLELIRSPNIREFECGGNPFLLSSVLMKLPLRTRFRNILIEDRTFFHELFENEFSVDKIKIIPKALLFKYNYSGRRGANIIDSQLKNSNSVFKKLRVFIFKILSIKKIKINIIKLLIFSLANIQFSTRLDKKRVAVSINLKSSEYKNLKRFSDAYNIPKFLNVFFKLGWEKRNRLFCDADTFKKLIVAVMYGKLANVRYAYIGLSGARFIKDYVETPSETIKIHVVHGRNMGEKFNTYTDAALTQIDNEKGKVPAGKIWFLKVENQFNYKDDTAIWFHGFQKGKKYSIRNFWDDWRLTLQLARSYRTLNVIPHPLAWKFKIYLKYFTRYHLDFNSYKEQKINCSTIYSSSPSISKLGLSKQVQKLGINFVDLLP
tara:strand:- start:6033 stop:7610 length:1578 start_codon:yes stop_codon:yes gene_type:complete